MKTKQRFKNRTAQPMKVNLGSVSDKELFGELIKRLIIKDKRVCYFIDTNHKGDWDLHTAHSNMLFEITSEELINV
jgi:hypothetical protein